MPTSILPRVALRPVLRKFNNRSYFVWQSVIPVLTGRDGVSLATIEGRTRIDPITGRLRIGHERNHIAGQITLEGIGRAPGALESVFEFRSIGGAVSASAKVTSTRFVLTYTNPAGQTFNWGHDFSGDPEATLGDAANLIDANSHWDMRLLEGADATALWSDVVSFAGRDALDWVAVQSFVGSVGHARAGTLQCLTTVSLGGAPVVWNTSGTCEPVARSPAVDGPRARQTRCNRLDSPSCPEVIYNVGERCQDPGASPDIVCISCAQDPQHRCGVVFQASQSTSICAPFGVGARGINTQWGQLVKPDAASLAIDRDVRSWLTQYGEIEEGQIVSEADAFERHSGGHAKYYTGDFSAEVCPCHGQPFCASARVQWLCNWKIWNGLAQHELVCNGPWGPFRWPGQWDDPPGSNDPRPESDRRPFDVAIGPDRRIVFVDFSLSNTSCFATHSVYCFTDSHEDTDIWDNIVTGNHLERLIAIDWLAVDFVGLRFTTDTGAGGRYPQLWPATMTRRTDALKEFVSMNGVDTFDIRPEHPRRNDFLATDLNRWQYAATGLDRPIRHASGPDAGTEIPITVRAFYSGVEWPALWRLESATLTMYVDVETYNGPIGGPFDEFYQGFRFSGTVDVVLTTRVRLVTPVVPNVAGGPEFLNADPFDLRFADPDNPGAVHPYEFATVRGPDGERIPTIVRWRGGHGPYPYLRGWDSRFGESAATGLQRNRGFEAPPPTPGCTNTQKACCRAHNVMHGASLWAEPDRHEATVPTDLDEEIIWPAQMQSGRILIYIPAFEPPNLKADYGCECPAL